MAKAQKPTDFKIRKLTLKNFKAIDELVLDFPAPEFDDEPDMVVIGSKNGVGKTSVLEAICLLVVGAMSLSTHKDGRKRGYGQVFKRDLHKPLKQFVRK
jgi:recombinational DNA repair ATPase RecF